MKKQKLKQLMACALICTSIGTGVISMKRTTVKAMSFDKVYESTFDCLAKLTDLGNQYYITPRLSNNGSEMEDNRLENLINSVGEIQSEIDKLRTFQHQFPSAYWKARNTFSEIGDSYQQPIYEWIVDSAIRMNKCATTAFLGEIHNDADKDLLVMSIQKSITGATILNKGVDPAYRGAYQAALDEDQKKLDDLLEVKFKKAQKIGKILGNTYKDQLKYKEEFYKELNKKEKNKLKTLDDKLASKPMQALVDILEECKDMKKNPNLYSAKYKVAFVNNIVNFMLVDMFNNDNSKNLNNSATYRFNKEFLDKTIVLEKNVNDYTDKATVATRTIELKEANKELLRTCGEKNLVSFEAAFKGIEPSKISNEKTLEEQEAEVIKYEDELRKKQEAKRDKEYQDVINNSAKEKTLEEQQSEEIKHEDEIIKDEEANREKIYEKLDKKASKEKTIEEQQKEELKHESDIIKKQENEREKAYQKL